MDAQSYQLAGYVSSYKNSKAGVIEALRDTGIEPKRSASIREKPIYWVIADSNKITSNTMSNLSKEIESLSKYKFKEHDIEPIKTKYAKDYEQANGAKLILSLMALTIGTVALTILGITNPFASMVLLVVATSGGVGSIKYGFEYAPAAYKHYLKSDKSIKEDLEKEKKEFEATANRLLEKAQRKEKSRASTTR